ncbi:MAG: hypothetical protein IH987_08565, partial [Planctomycetes bacterium]|nr:hypothetical protein [Planctomycetota bacterium]
SNGFKFYLADHPDDERLFNTGDQETAYRHFLDWVGGSLSEEIGVLFHPNDPANRLYPRQKTLDELLDLLNDEELSDIWEQDETIGWVYQYFTPKELRDQARSESRSPRNSCRKIRSIMIIFAFRWRTHSPRPVQAATCRTTSAPFRRAEHLLSSQTGSLASGEFREHRPRSQRNLFAASTDTRAWCPA